MIYRFKTPCCPTANGRTPVVGEQRWDIDFRTEDGGTLTVSMGKEARAALKAMLDQEEADDKKPPEYGSCDACGFPNKPDGCCSRSQCYNSE